MYMYAVALCHTHTDMHTHAHTHAHTHTHTHTDNDKSESVFTIALCSQNRPTGDCYVQMTTVEAAAKAADRLHRRNMGRRYIEVFQVSGQGGSK